ncbi:MAG TPA: MFS transporter [Pseudonocardiaceae bacterium]|nr:MFS transporter [Pseudonocardiaceae bacterium]
MAMGNYRRVLSRPGVRTLLLLMFASRIPVTATNMVLTLHVVLTLHRDYGAAGLVGAAGTIGVALGAPLTGRLVDAFGLRKMVMITTVAYGAYWLVAWTLTYPVLLVASFVGGVFALPVISIGRQALAALVPTEDRKTAFSLDSISVEMSFMVGPAVGVLIATKVSTTAAVISVGVLLCFAGLALFVVNPPVRGVHDEEPPDGVRPPRRQWLRAPMLATLATGCGAVFVLAGTEVTMVAALRAVGEVGWTGIVTISMCLASAAGGVVYGAVHRTPGPLLLLSLLGLLAVPVGLVGGQWWVLCLALVPTNLMCAPTLASTADRISRLAPAAVRGEAMGLQSSALTLGGALGSPVVGTVVDHWGPPGGFAAAGIGGVLIAVLLVPLARRRDRPEPGAVDQAVPVSVTAN